jgi:hypothetical protein
MFGLSDFFNSKTAQDVFTNNAAAQQAMNQQAASLANNVGVVANSINSAIDPYYFTNQTNTMGANGIQAMPAPKQPEGSFTFVLEKIEDGYVVHVSRGTPYEHTGMKTNKRYIAAELDEALDKAKVGIVTMQMEK